MKVLIISHVADLDGVMPVVLTGLAFSSYDYQLLDIAEVDSFFLERVNTDFFSSYDQIFLTDLGVSEEVAKVIDSSSWKDKFHILDHHKGNLFLNDYSFAEVVVSKGDILESGTSLYYQYLLKHHATKLLIQDSVSYMVSLTRLLDTWEWKKWDKKEALYLGTLLVFYGNKKFIENYLSFLKQNENFYFTDAEKVMIEADERKKQEYIEEKKQSMIVKKIASYQVGIVFAEQYVSELGNVLAETFQDQVDLVMIIRMGRSLSFRSVKEKVDVSLFAQHFHGNGHLHAAGAPLPEDLEDTIITHLIEGMIE